MTIIASMFNKYVGDRYLKTYYQTQMDTTFFYVQYFSDRYNLNFSDVLAEWLHYTYCKSESFNTERDNGLKAAEKSGFEKEYFFPSLLYGFFIWYSSKNNTINPVLFEIGKIIIEIATAGSISILILSEDEYQRLELLKVGDKVVYFEDEEIKRYVSKYIKGLFHCNTRMGYKSFSTILQHFFTYLQGYSYIKTSEEKSNIEVILNHYYRIYQDGIPQTIADNQRLYNSYS